MVLGELVMEWMGFMICFWIVCVLCNLVFGIWYSVWVCDGVVGWWWVLVLVLVLVDGLLRYISHRDALPERSALVNYSTYI